MCADFKVSGKHPFWKDRFTILVMTGTSSSTHFLSSQMGIGSRSHDVDGDFMIISLTASSDIVDKSENVAHKTTMKFEDIAGRFFLFKCYRSL